MTAIARRATMATLGVFLLTLLMLPSALVFAATITVGVDKTSYAPNNVLKVSGTVSPVTTGYDVAILVKGPTGEQRAVEQATPNVDGTFSKDVLTFSGSNPSGTWTVTATYQGASAIATFTFTGIPPQTNIVVNVAVSSGQVFVAGDKVDCYFMSSYSGKALDANYTVSLYRPTGSPTTITVSKLATGLYRGSTTLASNATAGTYTVMATANINTAQYLGVGLGLASFEVSGTLSSINTGVTTANTGISNVQKNFPITVDLSAIWIAIVLSLIAAIAAVYSTITVQRKIAG